MRRLITVFFAGLLAFCVLELTARSYLFPQYTAMLPDMYGVHPVLGHFNKPNLSARRYNPMNYDVLNHTNSLGLRGLEKDRAKELAEIWVAGASNTFAGFVEDSETYAAQLRRHGYWAANLASEGHGIVNQTLVIRMLAEQGYRPRAIILGITMYQAISDYSSNQDAFTRPLGNAFQSAAKKMNRPRDNLRDAAIGLSDAFPLSLQSVRARLLKTSALYGWGKVGIMGVPSLRDWTLKIGLRNDLYLVRNFDLNLLRPLTTTNPRTRDIASTAQYIAALGDMVERSFGVPFGVVLMPSLQQMDPESLARFKVHYKLENEDLDQHRAPAALRSALGGQGVAVLDALPALKRSGIVGKKLHFPDDGHLTPQAHAVIGKAIATWLDMGLGTRTPVGQRK